MVKSSSSSEEEKKLSPEIRSLRSRLFSFGARRRRMDGVEGRWTKRMRTGTVRVSTFPLIVPILFPFEDAGNFVPEQKVPGEGQH